MSGGHWDYIQYRFTDVSEDIDRIIEQNGVKKSEDEIIKDNPWVVKGDIPDYLRFEYNYSDKTIEKLKEARDTIEKAQIYMQRVDWLLSGDDEEESFLRRLKEEL
jgi:uncharacterized protein (DUF433 family)